MEDKTTNGLKEQRERRKRVNRIKTGIILTIVIWMLVSMILTVTLLCRVFSLQKQIDKLTAASMLSSVVEQGENQANRQENIGTELAPETNRPVKDEQDNNLNVVSVAANDESNRAQDGETHKVYLTFDDGPSSNTAEILDLLAQYNVKATFFVVGKTDEESVAMYKRIVEEGHTLGMHSYSHKYSMIYDSLDNFTADFTQIQNYLYDVTGVDCVYYRFPGGSSNKVSNTDMAEFIGYLNDQGVTYFDWNVASGDATSQAYTAQDLVDNVMQDVVKYKTSVVLMHDADNKDKTVEALGMILEQLQEQGAEVLPIDSDTAVIQHISADVAQ
ncbi:MAG: polysaccharide deacetylase [Lachnospiraceae bacterium]|nr:polysaccharide deacetylase [Lachnospiraceae bacterium]